MPGCEDCHRTLDAFGAVAGDLALAAEPIDPPELLLARIHRDMEPAGSGRRLATGWLVAAAAGIVALVAAGGLALSGGGTSATLAAADLQTIGGVLARPDAHTNDLGAVDEVTLPDRSEFYLWGEDVPPPPPGQVYRLWLLVGGEAHYVGEIVPDPAGVVAIHVEVEGTYDEVVVTTEAAAEPPGQPTGGLVRGSQRCRLSLTLGAGPGRGATPAGTRRT